MNYKESIYNIHLVDEGYIKHGVVDDDLIYNIRTGQIGNLSNSVDISSPSNALLQKGFIVPEDINEADIIHKQQVAKFANNTPKRIAFNIAVTLECNYSCNYCFEECDRTINMTTVTENEIIAYIKKAIVSNNNLEQVSLYWFGGEPLLRIDVIRNISKSIIEFCELRGIEYFARIITNGYLFTHDVSKELKELKVQAAMINLDGFEKTYNEYKNPPIGAYRTVLENIENSSIGVTIRLHVTRHNKDEIVELAKRLFQLPSIKNNHHKIHIQRVLEYRDELAYGFRDNEWIECLEHLSKELLPYVPLHIAQRMINSSIAPRIARCAYRYSNNVVLCCDGMIYKCEYFLGDKTKSVGKIKDGIDINSMIYNEFTSSSIDEDCLKCKILPFCTSGDCLYKDMILGKTCNFEHELFKVYINDYINYVYLKRNLHGSGLPLK